MTKVKTDMKRIRNGYKKVFRAGYCDLQNIYRFEYPQFYNCGVYGWNCDIYIDYKRDIAITTGYRNMVGANIPSDIFKKYNDKAKQILEKHTFGNYDEIKTLLDENRENFLNELDKL